MTKTYFFKQYANVPTCKLGVGYREVECKEGYAECDPEKDIDIITFFVGTLVTPDAKASRVEKKIKELPKGEGK